MHYKKSFYFLITIAWRIGCPHIGKDIRVRGLWREEGNEERDRERDIETEKEENGERRKGEAVFASSEEILGERERKREK